MPKGTYKRTKENSGFTKGKHWALSKETRLKMSISKLGHKPTLGNTGNKHSPETLLKISNALSGNKHPNWRGGIGRDDYSINWTNTLKRAIRERDNYVCRLCGIAQDEKLHAVHHIDYNKKNCSPDNLVLLCNSCHNKTNYNREVYIKLFNLLLRKEV